MKRFYRYKITNLINIQRIVTVHYQELVAGYRAEEEAHDFWELIYADKRSVLVYTDGKCDRLRQGYAEFIRPNAAHYVAAEEDANIFIISFECRSESMRLFEDRILEVPADRRPLIRTVMAEAKRTFRIPDFDPNLNRLELLPSHEIGGEQVIKNTLELLLVYLLRRENENAPRPLFSEFESADDLEKAILKYLEAHLAGPFSLDMLGAELHYGKTRLCTFFRERTGRTIYDTYLSMRIDEAKRLVRKGLSSSEIAYRLGFSSLSHFLCVFAKYAGCTPREYRTSVKG